jgi:isoleucyl-tRNA synthetase
LGKEYGPKMKDIASAINNLNQNDISSLEKERIFPLNLGDNTVNITLEDVDITSEDIPGWSVATEGNFTVALDIQITEELKQEGIARDLVNRVQNLRKEMGLDVQDKIKISVERNVELVNNALESYKNYICSETQASHLKLIDNLENGTVLEMDDFQLRIKVEELNKAVI